MGNMQWAMAICCRYCLLHIANLRIAYCLLPIAYCPLPIAGFSLLFILLKSLSFV
jgi:hypothetical protein